MKWMLCLCLVSLLCLSCTAQKPRARDLGVPFRGTPGALNAITDVQGVEVGHCTLISGSGKNVAGKGPVRTGVTAIFPRGKRFNPVYANWYSLNGNGEMTGTTWVTESGFLETPIMITNTNSVGVVRDAVLKWYVDTDWYRGEDWWYTYPLVAETYDGFLNDIYGFHVKEEHVLKAIADAKVGKVAEGNVGGGTGMMCLGFKGGIGTSSRLVKVNGEEYTLGVLVQSNFGGRKNLLPHQLKRIAQRVPLGIARVGGHGSNGSGDIFLAFSTANEDAFNRDETVSVTSLPNDRITPLFEATTHAVEEAIINAMVAAETMEGNNGNKVYALPHDLLIQVLEKYNRLEK